MFLTQENAKDYVGKKIDANKRILHYYPLTIFQFSDGSYGVEDCVGVCFRITEKIYFDKILENSDDKN
jgi:hypothetical protein